MRAWARPKPVPSKPTFMAPSVVSLGPVARLGCIMALASDNHACHASRLGDQPVAPGALAARHVWFRGW